MNDDLNIANILDMLEFTINFICIKNVNKNLNRYYTSLGITVLIFLIG